MWVELQFDYEHCCNLCSIKQLLTKTKLCASLSKLTSLLQNRTSDHKFHIRLMLASAPLHWLLWVNFKASCQTIRQVMHDDVTKTSFTAKKKGDSLNYEQQRQQQGAASNTYFSLQEWQYLQLESSCPIVANFSKLSHLIDCLFVYVLVGW